MQATLGAQHWKPVVASRQAGSSRIVNSSVVSAAALAEYSVSNSLTRKTFLWYAYCYIAIVTGKRASMTKKQYREYNRLTQCVECLQMFDANRYDARYCSNRCRVAAKRWRDKAGKLALEAQEVLLHMRPYMKTELGKDLYPKLKLIQGLCSVLMDDYDFTRPLENGQ